MNIFLYKDFWARISKKIDKNFPYESTKYLKLIDKKNEISKYNSA